MSKLLLITRYSLISFLVVLLWGCLDKIELEVPKGFETTFVIQGSVIVGNPSKVNINASRLFDFTSNSVQSVNVRSVIIEDENGNQIEIPPTDEIGTYEATVFANNPNFSFEEGKSYRLLITTFDNRNFASAFETALPKIEADALSSEVFTKEISDGMEGFIDKPFMRYRISTPINYLDTPDKPYLRWTSERTFQITDGSNVVPVEPKTCYVTQKTDVNDIFVLDASSITVDKLDNFTVLEDLIRSNYAEGQYMTIFQQTINKGVYDYWNSIKIITERSGSMFDPPAGKITSNISNPDDPSEEIFGYFFVAQQDTIRLYVSPEMAGSPENACPPPNEMAPPGGGCPVLICCDCLSAERSSTGKPKFWKE